MRLALTLITLAGLLALGLSHLGRWLPPGDSLAVLRPQMLAAALPVLAALAWSGRRRLALAALALVLLSAGDTARLWRGTAPDPGRDLTLYQKNLRFDATAQADLEAEIRALSPDVLTLQEVTGDNFAMVERLRADYPYQVHCPWRAVGGPAIVSRLAVTERYCLVNGLALARIEGPTGPLWLASLHLEWPWPFGQSEQLGRVLAILEGLDAPLVLAGDFNMVPWGASVRRVAEAGSVVRAGRYASTFRRFGPLLPLAIDHVLLPEGASGEVTLRPTLGSDHAGLLARIDLP